MYTFQEFCEARLAPGTKYTRRINKEMLEDAEATYNMLINVAKSPPKNMKWLTYGYDHWLKPENKERMINYALELLAPKAWVGMTRGNAKRLMQNYMAQLWQKEPMTRRAVEFGQSIGWQPTMTVGNDRFGSQQYVSPSQDVVSSQDVGLTFTPRKTGRQPGYSPGIKEKPVRRLYRYGA